MMHGNFPCAGTAFRVDARSYSISNADGDHYASETKIELSVAQITRFTPKGFYFVDWTDSVGWHERLVLDRWAKKQVNRTVEGALKDFLARRRAALSIYSRRVEQAKTEIAMAEWSGMLGRLQAKADHYAKGKNPWQA